MYGLGRIVERLTAWLKNACSLCLGAVPRRVSVDATTIDGQPSGRALDPEGGRQSFYARRGGIMKGRRTH